MTTVRLIIRIVGGVALSWVVLRWLIISPYLLWQEKRSKH